MVTMTPAVQVAVVDTGTTPTTSFPIVPGGAPISCPSGVLLQDATVAAATADSYISFPMGVTTATFVYIVAVTTTDLIVKVGSGSPVALTVPLGQCLVFYNIAPANLTISSVLGGVIQYAIGG